MAYDKKIELQIAPLADAQESAETCRGKFGAREHALAFITRRSPRPRINPFQPLKLHLKLLIANDNPTRIVTLSDQRESKGLSFLLLKPARARILIANLELEFLASRTKFSLLTFSNRKKIAVFHPCPSRCRLLEPVHPHISNRNSSFTEFRSTCCKHTPYQISNRNKNAHFAFSDSTSASHQSHAANRESRTTTRAAFRSTIPARPHADR
jgi:hypothetical protein